MDKLNKKQQSFVINYIKNGFNGTQAMLEAGYTKASANYRVGELISHPVINKQITKAFNDYQLEQYNQVKIALKDKADMLMRIIDDVLPKDGEPKRQYYRDAIKAIDMLNKLSGHYAPNKSVSITMDTTREKLLEAKRVYDEY